MTSQTETVAMWMMRNGYATGHGDTLHDLLVELVGQAREEGYKEADMGTRACKLVSSDGEDQIPAHINLTRAEMTYAAAVITASAIDDDC